MNSKAQVDIIDMQCQRDGDLIWILVYQDDLTKLVQLCPVKLKRATEIAYQLLIIFNIFGAPTTLQSDDDREFMAVHLKPKHSQNEGSVERANRDIKDMLTMWLQSNATTCWSDGLRFVLIMKNGTYHEGVKC